MIPADEESSRRKKGLVAVPLNSLALTAESILIFHSESLLLFGWMQHAAAADRYWLHALAAAQ
jgi:hypothetical protein